MLYQPRQRFSGKSLTDPNPCKCFCDLSRVALEDTPDTNEGPLAKRPSENSESHCRFEKLAKNTLPPDSGRSAVKESHQILTGQRLDGGTVRPNKELLEATVVQTPRQQSRSAFIRPDQLADIPLL